MSRLTNFPNGIGGFLVDDQAVAKEAAYTVIINTDSGKTFTSETDGQVFTLPSLAAGNTIRFVNMAEDGAASLNISPAAADAISYTGNSVANKDLINDKTVSRRGDYVTLTSLSGALWQVTAARGIWSKEA